MSEAAAKVLEQAMTLTTDDRKAVRRALREQRLAELEKEDARVIQERSDSVHSGTAELLDGEQVEAELMDRLRRRGSL